MEKQKQPMSKAKKNFIGAIIWLIAGVMIIVTGGIMVSESKQIVWIFGIVVLCCGVTVTALGIYMMIKYKKLMNQEKAH